MRKASFLRLYILLTALVVGMCGVTPAWADEGDGEEEYYNRPIYSEEEYTIIYDDPALGVEPLPETFRFTRMNIAENKIWAVNEGEEEIEGIRVVYGRYGDGVSRGGMMNVMLFQKAIDEELFDSWGFSDVGIWTAYQVTGVGVIERSSQREYDFSVEQPIIQTGTMELGEVGDDRVYYTVKAWKGGEEVIYAGEIDYSSCDTDGGECWLDPEASTEFHKVMALGEEPVVLEQGSNTGVEVGKNVENLEEEVKDEDETSEEQTDEGEENQDEEAGSQEEVKKDGEAEIALKVPLVASTVAPKTVSKAVSRASEAISSDDTGETGMDSDLDSENAYDGSNGLETPILGGGIGQEKEFPWGWFLIGLLGLGLLGVTIWWFWPVFFREKQEKEAEK